MGDDQEFNERYEVHTLRDVLKEIKDENARTYLETRLPYSLIVHDSLSDPAHLQRVVAFAKETGDFASLSATDLKVMALGIELAEAQGEGERLQKEPKELNEFRPKRFEEEYKRVLEGEVDEDSDETLPAETKPDDGFETVTQKKHGDRRNHIRPKAPEEKPVIVE